ncbi:HipA domain-containing protein [Hydrogenophaga sp.]|uniref:HipA domain-containing protein n=1 Tax=Hydrogenophaga sp. TaxID=1904254 RepID=UPI0035B0630A
MSRLKTAAATRARCRLGQGLCQVRRQRGWARRDLAGQLAVSVSTIQRIERGDPGVALKTLMHAAVLLGLLREFARLLERHFVSYSSEVAPWGTKASGDEARAKINLDLAPETRILLPKSSCGPRLAKHFSVLLGVQAIPMGEVRLRSVAKARLIEFLPGDAWSTHGCIVSTSPRGREIKASQRIWLTKCEWRNKYAALVDATPSGFGGRVVRRAAEVGLLDVFRGSGEVPSCFDDLCAVLDVARLGALRVVPHREVPTDRLMDALMLPCEGALSQIEAATRAFEIGEEDQRQLLLLLYCATALGGARLKSTWIDGNGQLSMAKFDSGLEGLSLNRAEVLAMHLAAAAGIDAVRVRLLNPVLRPILVGERFDRTEVGERRPFLSARSLLVAQGRDDVGPLDLLQAMRVHCRDFSGDASQLWQRLVFMRLIWQPGDVLRKIGFLYAGHGRWRLAPAYGLRLYPAFEPKDEAPASQGLRLTLKDLMERAGEFGLGPDQARWYLSRQLNSLGRWRTVASQFFVHINARDIERLEPAIHGSLIDGARLLRMCQSSTSPYQRHVDLSVL